MLGLNNNRASASAARFTTYNVVVQAYNGRGAGPMSEPVTVRTMEDGEQSRQTIMTVIL